MLIESLFCEVLSGSLLYIKCLGMECLCVQERQSKSVNLELAVSKGGGEGGEGKVEVVVVGYRGWSWTVGGSSHGAGCCGRWRGP